MTSSPLLSWSPRLKVGRYELLSPIAQGGMAEVWLARTKGPEQFEKIVALKRILASAGTATETVHMFLDEARIAASLSHPNIAQTFELAEDGGTYYLAMEYLEGETVSYVLDRALEQGKPLPVGLALRIAADAAAGLGHAHHQRSRAGKPLDIVHRDVSPDNIMVTYEGVVKVVDFGIARAAQRLTRTMLGVLKGKVEYMSPEQARSGDVDARADVFALGVVMFEMLTGMPLHPAGDEAKALAKLVDGAPLPTPRSRVPELSVEIDALVTRAMAHDPAQRFASGLELQAAIEQCLRGVPPPSSAFDLRQYMQASFGDRMQQRRQMVAVSTGSGLEAPVPPLVPHPSSERPTAVARVLPNRPTFGGEASGVSKARAPNRLWSPAVIGAGIAALIGLGLAVYAATRESAPPRAPVLPVVVTEAPDASVAAAATPDAGAPPVEAAAVVEPAPVEPPEPKKPVEKKRTVKKPRPR